MPSLFSSSSCTNSTDFPDSLSLSVPTVHRSWQVLQTTSSVHTVNAKKTYQLLVALIYIHYIYIYIYILRERGRFEGQWGASVNFATRYAFYSQPIYIYIMKIILDLVFKFYYYHNYFTYLRVVHTSCSWWFSTGVWMIASLLKSLGLFSVF